MCIVNRICDAEEPDLEMQKLWYKFIFKVTSHHTSRELNYQFLLVLTELQHGGEDWN